MTASAASQVLGRRPADLKRLEERRRRAARLFAKGVSQAEVARRLGVSAQTASRWHARWMKDGTRGLRARPRSGRPAQLTSRQLAQLRQVVLDGAVVAGFDNELWSLSRVQAVVAQRFDVRFHRSHVWRLVRAVGFTPQRPARRAVEHDEARIARWVAEDWPGIVKRLNAQSVALLPGRVRRPAEPAGAPYLGASRADPGAAPPRPPGRQHLDERDPLLPARRIGGPAGVRPARGRLRHLKPCSPA